MREGKIGGDKEKKMKKILKAILMTLAVVLAVIAFIAPSSAYSIDNGKVDCEDGLTTWTFTVSRDRGDNGISHWVVFWCNKNAVKEVWVDDDDITDKYGQYPDPGWEYMPADYPDPTTGLQGIKIAYGFEVSEVVVKIVLDGEYCDQTSHNVDYAIKHGNGKGKKVHYGTVYGPVAVCDIPIPEFATIALPIASILGLLFFFNRRKCRE